MSKKWHTYYYMDVDKERKVFLLTAQEQTLIKRRNEPEHPFSSADFLLALVNNTQDRIEDRDPSMLPESGDRQALIRSKQYALNLLQAMATVLRPYAANQMDEEIEKLLGGF